MVVTAGKTGLRTPPGPPGYPIVGSLLTWGRDPLQFFVRIRQSFGDVVGFRMLNRQFILLSNPEHIKYVLQDNNQNYEKNTPNFFLRRLEPLLGRGLATTNGDYWLKQRRLVQPAFHRQRVADWTGIMATSTQAMLGQWDERAASGRPIDLDSALRQLTLDILVHTLTPLGSEVTQDAEAVRAILQDWMARTRRLPSLILLLLDLPTRQNRRFHEAITTLDRVIYRLIDERRKAGAEGSDLLSVLLQARDADSGASLSDKEIRDQVATIFAGGFETTATALSFTFALLAQHPEVVRQLEQEVDTVLGDRTPTFADVPNLPYTSMVFEEALRLYPPNWALRRIPIADDAVGNYRIPAGTTVVLSTYVLHHDAQYWHEPERFDPSRFAAGEGAGRPRFAYFPFGGGPRQCIGNYFATIEAQIIIAMVVQRFRTHLVSGHQVRIQPSIPLRPKGGLPVTLERRVKRGAHVAPEVS